MKRKLIMQLCAIAMLCLIPALYAYIFLSAYWDPASHLSEIPVAVVNQDIGAMINGKSMNIGNSMVEKLQENHNIHWVFTTAKDADDGVASGKYYAELIISNDFTQCISTAAEPEKIKGTLRFISNDKLGTFASSVMSGISAGIESMISMSITENLIDSLANQLGALPGTLQKLSDGLASLDDGAERLYQGMAELVRGQTEYTQGVEKLAAGFAELGTGGNNLRDGLQKLSGKSSQFANALSLNSGKMDTLSESSGKMQAGLLAISASLNTYFDAATASLQKSIAIISLLQAYIADHPESAADPHMQQIISALGSMGGGTANPADAAAALKAAMSQLTGAYAQLNTAIQTLPNGMQTAADSAKALSDAIKRILNGSVSLSSGFATLNDGAELLLKNARLILSSEQKLQNGVEQLRNGIRQIKSSVGDSVLQLNDSSAALQGFAGYAADPVGMITSKIGEARNTGTAMAPFMLSLCLWLGGLMIVIIFTTMERFKFNEITPNRGLLDVGLFRFQLIAVIQSACLAFTAVNILGIEVENTLQFYGICILGGVAFITVIQLLVMAFQDFGKLLSIIFMLLQLTASGGMMSMELVPPFFKAIHSYMPMTYTINALRDNLLAMDSASYNHSMSVLAVTLVSGLLAVALISIIARLIRRNKIVPAQVSPVQ